MYERPTDISQPSPISPIVWFHISTFPNSSLGTIGRDIFLLEKEKRIADMVIKAGVASNVFEKATTKLH